jgi:hypothetical protein
MLTPGMLSAGKKSKKYKPGDLPKFRVRRLTSDPKHHFFGYYGMSPWNSSESHMACLESSFHDRMPKQGETATVGLVNPENGKFSPIAKTSAWNLQQGSLIHWNPLQAESEIIYNDIVDKEMASVRLDVFNGKKTVLPRPISAVAKKGKYALSLTYGRLSRMRKVVGYAGAVDPYANEAHPSKDGVFLIDLEKNRSKLIVSIAEVFEKSVADYPLLAKRHIWFNHTDINPSGTRFLFLARSRNEKGKIDSAMFTANMDGSDLRMVIPFGNGVSHFCWRNDREIVAVHRQKPEDKKLKHIIFTDGEQDFRVIGEDFIIDNGHCTFTPNGRWMATDRKQDESHSFSLWMYDMELDKGMMLSNKPMFEYSHMHGDMRCDFHPRWNPSGNKICFDAIDTATLTRQLHLVDFIDV